jgi:hypothetical protein
MGTAADGHGDEHGHHHEQTHEQAHGEGGCVQIDGLQGQHQSGTGKTRVRDRQQRDQAQRERRTVYFKYCH